MTIGELAAASGVPAKTIRYYADLGVLPEAARSPGGYRLFDREDLARLELVRALRALDFDLATIKGLLAEPRSMTQVVDLHLEAVEVQLRDLQRTRAVLRAARDAGADEGAAYLRRLQVLATMSAAERTALVRDFFAGTAEGVPVDRDWLAELTEAGLPELPDEPTAAQLDAWLELAGLVTDETFRRNVRANAAGFWSEVEGVDVREFGKRAADVAAEADAAAEAGADPSSAEGRRIADALVDVYAGALGRPPADVRVWLREQYASHDPRAARYWELLATIRGEPPQDPDPVTRAHEFLGAALTR